MNVDEVIKAALEAEEKGVPVSWRDLCLRIYSSASNDIRKLQKQLDDAKEGNELSPGE